MAILIRLTIFPRLDPKFYVVSAADKEIELARKRVEPFSLHKLKGGSGCVRIVVT